MKTSQADILILPGLKGPDDDLWLTRWERKLPTAQIVGQPDWHAPNASEWSARLGGAVAQATRPVILVAHGIGCHVVAHAVDAGIDLGPVAGAYLVAAPDPQSRRRRGSPHRAFGEHPRSRHCPWPPHDRGLQRSPLGPPGAAPAPSAPAWGAKFVDAGEIRAIDFRSPVVGPGPEG